MSEYLIQDTTLNAIADAINAKTGGSSAMTPAEMVTEIESISGGGEETDYLAERLSGTLESYENSDLATVSDGSFYRATALKTVNLPNVTQLKQECFMRSGITSAHFPKASVGSSTFTDCSSLLTAVVKHLTSNCSTAFRSCTNLLSVDVGISGGSLMAYAFNGCTKLTTLVFRSTSIVKMSYPVGAANPLYNTPFYNNGSGGTIYIPKVLYDHLGDGTSLDYKAASNWSAVDAFGKITWAQIEGSIYETQYADGTPIPTT